MNLVLPLAATRQGAWEYALPTAATESKHNVQVRPGSFQPRACPHPLPPQGAGR